LRRSLAIHQLSALDMPVLDFVDLAAAVGCEKVCIFAHWPPNMRTEIAAVSRAEKGEFLTRLADHGLGVSGADFYPITPELDLKGYERGVAFAAELGARHLITAVDDTEEARAVANLGALTEMAAAHGLRIGLEFMTLAPGCRTIGKGAWFVDQVGLPNIGLNMDVLHLTRSGGTAADVAALEPRYFNNAQICDGRGRHVSDDYLIEAGADRLTPGAGDFALHEVFAAVPAETPMDLEVPSRTRDGKSAKDFLADAARRARQILEEAAPTR
jgi:sugar phosphate isomerase/epimerase